MFTPAKRTFSLHQTGPVLAGVLAAVAMMMVFGAMMFMKNAGPPDKMGGVAAAGQMRSLDFYELCRYGTVQQVANAIKNGADVNMENGYGTRPLMPAAQYNPDPEVITELVNAKADVNVKNNAGTTPLMFAAMSNRNTKMITALVNARADVNAKGRFEMTPLMFAARNNRNPEVITALVNARADVDARNDIGQTPLMFAAMINRNPEVMTALLNARADAKARDNQGKMAIDYARENRSLRNTDAFRRLEEASR